MKHRKLSTVSTMSSQLKLMSKLKTNMSACCSSCCQPLVCFGCGTPAALSNSGPSTAAAAAAAAAQCLGSQSMLGKQLRQQMRRSTFVPEQKLEELRDLRIQLDKDKQEWQTKFNKMQEQLLNERRELDLAREKLKLERQATANEREQLYRKLDVLKEKGILLSPSHKVIITTPELRVHPPANANCEIYGQTIHHQYSLGSNLRQAPLNHRVMGNHSSSIQIVQQRSPQQTIASCDDKRQQMPTNLPAVSNQQRSPSLHNGKVPLHLSEGGHQRALNSTNSSSSLLGRVVPSLIGSTSERLCGPNVANSGRHPPSYSLNSHVI